VIEAEQFVEAARALGLQAYAGVPCSFLTPFINYVIDSPALAYVSAANEGDAVAVAAGFAIGGRPAAALMQNSGLGNAVSPLTSLTHVFRIPVLLVCTHRGAPGSSDEPQHGLMGSITPALLETMGIPAEPFPATPASVAACLGRASAHMRGERRPYGLIMAKGSVAQHALAGARGPRRFAGAARVEAAGEPPAMPPPRGEILAQVLALTADGATAVFATTGYTGRELYALGDRGNHLYMVGSMGCASSLALGFALARPDCRVLVIDGDGAALMRLGNLATIGAEAPRNLVHLLIDNEAHDSTGAQATASSAIDFAGVAAACGYAAVYRGDPGRALERALGGPTAGPVFVHVKSAPGTLAALPRPAIGPEAVLDRFMAHFGTRFALAAQ